MSEPFLGEIRVTSFNFAPKGWAFCNGQLLPINQNQALFSLLGTMYGGNGQTTFALPDLRDRVPMCFGDQYAQGTSPGEAAHTLIPAEVPVHAHSLHAAVAAGTTDSPAGAVLADSGATDAYSRGGPNTALNAETILAGNPAQPHENRQPYLALSFIIALQGIFPSRN